MNYSHVCTRTKCQKHLSYPAVPFTGLQLQLFSNCVTNTQTLGSTFTDVHMKWTQKETSACGEVIMSDEADTDHRIMSKLYVTIETLSVQ